MLAERKPTTEFWSDAVPWEPRSEGPRRLRGDWKAETRQERGGPNDISALKTGQGGSDPVQKAGGRRTLRLPAGRVHACAACDRRWRRPFSHILCKPNRAYQTGRTFQKEGRQPRGRLRRIDLRLKSWREETAVTRRKPGWRVPRGVEFPFSIAQTQRGAGPFSLLDRVFVTRQP